MAVSKDEFEKMPVVPYNQARARPDGLRTGDVLLFHSTDLASDMTEIFTNSLWCHAAFIWNIAEADRVLVLESVEKIGVRAMPMSAKINGSAASPKPFGGGLLVARHEDMALKPDPQKIHSMTEYALDRIGYPYSQKELAEIMIRIALAKLGDIVQGRLDPKNQFICSEYVASCYHAMGIELAPEKLGFIAPGDIANDPKIHAVWSLRHD
jgi:hypothetical protein